MMLIGLGYKFMGGTVTNITRKGVLVQDVDTPATRHDHILLSLKEAEKFAGEGKFSCGDSNG